MAPQTSDSTQRRLAVGLLAAGLVIAAFGLLHRILFAPLAGAAATDTQRTFRYLADLPGSAVFVLGGLLVALVAAACHGLASGRLKATAPGAARLAGTAGRDRRWLLLGLAATVATLCIGFAVKAPCTSHPWDNYQYTHRCYNDVLPLYYYRGMDHDTFPYVGHDGRHVNADGTGEPLGFVEYPVLTGLVMYGEAVLSPDGGAGASAFIGWNMAFMAVAALAVTWGLWWWGLRGPRLLWFAAAPSLALYAFHNWDLLAVALATWGLAAFQKGKVGLSGALLAAGACAKIYPGLFLPVLGMVLLQREAAGPKVGPLGWLGPLSWRFGLSAVGTLAALNGPLALWNRLRPNPDPGHPDLWLETFTFHLKRDPNYETPWFALSQWASKPGVNSMAKSIGIDDLPRWFLHSGPDLGVIVLVAGIAVLCLLVHQGKVGWLRGCFAALLLFLALNRIFSVQYALWALPFFATLELPWVTYATFLLGDALVYLTIWPFFVGLGAGADMATSYTVVGRSVLLRAAAIVILLAATLWPRAKPTAQGATGGARSPTP